MSIAFHSNRGIDIQTNGFTRAPVTCSLVFDSPEFPPEKERVAAVSGDNAVKESIIACGASTSSSSSSSIGKNSDLSGRSSSDGEECEENEAQSSYKGPLEMMEALEEVLPVRRGISKFYNGKSKSFASLGDASSTSINDIVKPENAYTRKRRNLLASNHFWDKNRNFPLRSNGGGIAKRSISSSRSTLALAMAMSSSESSCTSEDSNSSSASRSPPSLPPLHPQSRASNSNKFSTSPPRRSLYSSRSLSLADLEQ
ncbi:hypothetical protein FEM48_Zijuj06G0059500 [Ziziphus jujuba var. spinosa]|uniref:Uncharacterized protein n=1 Tax=Ziziphus jujuba var. spinosa TaxID=714518 RepID=A0A978V7K1_ZIZJJ|nr:hypothetical protein FEM48_Zijuj06G0059500 [Ziziphus jujuba var. spinosa]